MGLRRSYRLNSSLAGVQCETLFPTENAYPVGDGPQSYHWRSGRPSDCQRDLHGVEERGRHSDNEKNWPVEPYKAISVLSGHPARNRNDEILHH